MKLGFIPFLLLVVPILEIAMFITIGGQIGVLLTLAMIFLTAIIGTMLLRHQGFQVIREIQEKSKDGGIPGKALVHGAMLLVAGILLLTPGFVTDTVGFLLFVPPLRERLWSFLKTRVNLDIVTSAGPMGPGSPPSQGTSSKGPTIDLDSTEYGPANPDSPWNDRQGR